MRPGGVGAAARAALLGAGRRAAALPLAIRLLALVLVIAGAFLGVVGPLFSGGGAPQGEVSGAIPATVRVGQQVTADLAIDNVGDSIIAPVCLSLSGPGTHLVAANFQGLERITASGDRVCGGELTAQETISVTVVFAIDRPGTSTVTVLPEEARLVIGPALTASVSAG